MRCVFVARRQVGIVGARPARMAFAGGSEAGGSPLDDAPASRLPEADPLFAGRIPGCTRNRALCDARRVFGKPAHAATVLDDHRALRLQGLKRRGNRAQLSGQLADAQLPAAQRFHDRDLLDGVRAGRELGKRRAGDHPAIVHLANRGLLEPPAPVAPMHHARHAARRREQAHASRQRRDIAFGKPLGAGGALFIEIRLADGALDGLELARVDALRPLRPAGLSIFADRHHEAHGAPVTERHQHSAAHRNGEVAPKRAVIAVARAFACGGEQPLFRDCIGIRRIERLRRYVQDYRCQFHSAPVYQRFAESPRKGEQIYAFRESPALVPDSPVGPAFRSIPRPFDRDGEATPTRIGVAVADMAISPQQARSTEKPAGKRGISRNPGLCRACFQRAFPISRYQSGPPSFAAGSQADPGPASFRSMRRNRRKQTIRHALPPKDAENAYSRPQALRRASARSVASQVNSGSSRPKWP